jgi:hypothetical protein
VAHAVGLQTCTVPRCSPPEINTPRSKGTPRAAPLPPRLPDAARAAKPSVPIHACVLLL